MYPTTFFQRKYNKIEGTSTLKLAELKQLIEKYPKVWKKKIGK